MQPGLRSRVASIALGTAHANARAEVGTPIVRFSPRIDADLQRVVGAWDELAEHSKEGNSGSGGERWVAGLPYALRQRVRISAAFDLISICPRSSCRVICIS